MNLKIYENIESFMFCTISRRRGKKMKLQSGPTHVGLVGARAPTQFCNAALLFVNIIMIDTQCTYL